MANETTPYISRNPSDLITAEDWNQMQVKIKEDIAKQVKDAIDGINKVPNADNADKLENKSADELSSEILEKARQELPKLTGYRMLFKRLKTGDEKVIDHSLKACPLVDIYQLDYFPVVCAHDEQKDVMLVNFYLYHSSEKKIRLPNVQNPIEIEPLDSRPYKIKFADLLSLFKVKYTDTSSLDDLVLEFWKAVFASPNDEFDEDQYCHSPWFEKCCCDKKTVEDLKKRGDWNDIWFQMRPRKTVNYPAGPLVGEQSQTTQAPTNIQVVHFDFDTLGVKLLADPVYPPEWTAVSPDRGGRPVAVDELKIMLLLKV